MDMVNNDEATPSQSIHC